jgi:long-chain acyl-CoA synthetase
MDPAVWQRHYDPGVPPDLPADDGTLVDFLRRSVEAYPDRPALVFENRVMRYAELGDRVSGFAAALARLGMGPGTRVAIHLPNLPQFVVAYYGTLTAGAVAVPTNPLYTPPELEFQWRDAGCEMAVTTDWLYHQRVRAVRPRLAVRHYAVATIAEALRFPLSVLAPLALRRRRPPLAARIPAEAGVHRFGALVAGRRGPAPAVPLDPEATATLLYTGGTTGVSKGAELTHRNLASNARQLLAWIPQAEPGREVLLAALPLFHSFGLTVVMNAGVALGAALILIPDPRDVRGIARSIARHRVTFFAAVPTHFAAVADLAESEGVDLSSVRICNSGAAPLPEEVLRRFERLTGGKISEGFGLSEASPVTHSNPVESLRKIGSIGVPLPGTEARIVDPESGTRELPPGEVGELVIRGPQVMRGYWNRPDETAGQLKDGWLFTGDLARVDQDGFCYIAGRKKDMVISSGFNVYPDEVDRVLAAHPAVLEAASIGVPDARRGESVKAFVVLRAGHAASVSDLRAHCGEQLAPYKVPREIEFLDALPRSSVLKVLRRELRERELAHREHPTP